MEGGLIDNKQPSTMMMMRRGLILLLSLSSHLVHNVSGFTPSRTGSKSSCSKPTLNAATANPFQELLERIQSSPNFGGNVDVDRFCPARELVKSLVEDEQCFTTVEGAQNFIDACSEDVVYEDCSSPKTPIVGREAVTAHVMAKVSERQNRGRVRIDKISDGSSSCGYAWTWTSGNEEGLRGTTFVGIDKPQKKISYIREIPEPLYKPGDLTLELLKAVTKDAQPQPPKPYQSKTPKTANEVAKYLFLDVQGSDIDEAMRFFDENVVYRDFNYVDPLEGPAEVRKFIEDFSFPGITFAPERFDDGIYSSCFTWDVKLEGQETAIKGISFYEIDPETKKIIYVRDVPESPLKPPPLGLIARKLRPGLGVFQGVPIGNRPGGM
mmetsp:Transcript_13949/g.33455  ORF Transcript_13949/g.33455 Transcript_13949/m.33455 type:complete len:381 (-) Transcript_13949:2862-4004(-)|eukprot:CAMPEP_0113457132 /NCGR_PEP_ID=MMETSP0014_2-20120614/9249_1 /TAXON_ID=2857 /ORGANISM="Nitzschia sp." /LENGTH=380 /DNA_ID=CAMNT_0000348615 /DNA_START=1136 /DNA_END=2278 /DNA_ORIENTATION=- /assembly_acc=CAM_ASM_000159